MNHLALALLSSLLLTLSFLPALSGLSFGALLPLLIAIHPLPRRQSFAVSWLAGAVFHLLMNYWIFSTVVGVRGFIPFSLPMAILCGTAALFLVALLEGLFVGVFGWLVNLDARPHPSHNGGMKVVVVVTRHSSLITPLRIAASWTLIEYLRSLGPLGYPWAHLAVSQVNRLPMLQIAEFGGSNAVAFGIALVNGLLFLAILQRRTTPLLAAIVLTAGWYAGGIALMHSRNVNVVKTPTNVPVRIAIAQGCSHWLEKKDETKLRALFDRHARLTHSALRRAAQMVIWPETAVPTLWRDKQNEWLGDGLKQLAKQGRIDLLVGLVDTDDAEFLIRPTPSPSSYEREERGEGGLYNACVAFTPDGKVAGVHRKTQLIPFGEYVPLQERFPFLRAFAPETADFRPGLNLAPLRTSRGLVGVCICFESLFAKITRRLTRSGAQLLVIVTNDGWFGRTFAPYHHADMAVLRAIENRRFVARAANSGISCFIDPLGRVTAKTKLFTRRLLMGEVYFLDATTLYTRWGDWLVGLSVLLLVLAILPTVWRRTGRRLP